MPKDLYDYCRTIEDGCILRGFPALEYKKSEPLLCFNKYDYNFWGYEGWIEIGTKEEIKSKIDHYKKMLQFFDEVEEDF